jgi:hypothetical protein
LTTATTSSSPFLEDEHALENPHLRCGETDAARVVHQLLHARCEPLQILVEGGHLMCAHAQHGIAVLAHLRKGELASRLRLGVELGASSMTCPSISSATGAV